MASRIQPDRSWLPQSRHTAEERDFAAALGQQDISGGGTEAWLKSNGHRRRDTTRWHIASGPWIQVAYALIDVVCVLVSGAIAFLLRFSPSYLRHLIIDSHFAI